LSDATTYKKNSFEHLENILDNKSLTTNQEGSQ